MQRLLILLLGLFLITSDIFGNPVTVHHWESIFYSSTTFKYWSSNMGAPDAIWRNQGFNDDAWLEGTGGIGYGDNDDATTIDICNSVFLRKSFLIQDNSTIEQMLFYIDFDDAFVAYLNGAEIARSPGLADPYPAYNQLSTEQHEAGTREKFEVDPTLLSRILVNGQNILAVQVHNASSTSSDLSSNIDLIVGITTSAENYLQTPEWYVSAFTSSNLPILVIETNNQNIPDEPKITANLGIIYNGEGNRNYLSDPHNHYNGYIGIELRGNSTQNYPKKPYNIETRDASGANLNVSLLGMPEENDWVLRASYFDHTFTRNVLASHMSQQTGHWASRCRLVELVLNGDYQGIYILMEKIKRDKNRLDIATLNPDEITYPDITGGYIFEITGFANDFGNSRELKYPDIDDIAPEQLAYIKDYDDSFRSVMYSGNYADEVTGYKAWIDDDSFVDELIVQEAMRNSDAYGWSGYFHKDKEGKLKAGPVWDFDQSAGNSSYPDNGVITRWLFSHPSTINTPFFWPKLFDDPAFAWKVRTRWEEMREGPFQTETLMNYIDSIAELLSEAQSREFAKWPVLGQYIWRETTGYEQRNTYQKEVDYLKSFLTQRWVWMDHELAKIDNPHTEAVYLQNGPQNGEVRVYPVPAKNWITFDMTSENATNAVIQVFNMQGGLMLSSDRQYVQTGPNSIKLNLSNITSGIYFYKVFIEDQETFTGKIIKSDR